jgi:hypothetical protein
MTSSGWFKSFRSPDTAELVKANPHAFVLAFMIAFRAQWKSGWNRLGLEPGEALLGDFADLGMSEQSYRTAKKQLEKWNFATFKPTTKGTIARLTDTRLFDICFEQGNGQDNERLTDAQRTGNGRLTTTQTAKKDKTAEKETQGAVSPGVSINPLPSSLDTQRMRDKWSAWMEYRRGLKKPKAWERLFNEQLEWLTRFDEPTAFEILSASIRNGWTGLFPPRGTDRAPSSPPATSHTFVTSEIKP